MGDLTKITAAQLNSALTAQEKSLRKSLSTEDSSTLLALMEGLVRRYPTQDQAETIEEYYLDYEALTLRHGICKVEKAVTALRIDPEQEFFPKPNEVAHEIDQQNLKALPSHLYARL
jgi:hypothetical protein